MDFNIINCYGFCDFNGCNIKKLPDSIENIEINDFDDEAKRKFPNVFLPDDFSTDFFKKYYSSKSIREVKCKIVTVNVNHIIERVIDINKMELFNEKNNYLP